jgi:hypothetical protein
MSCRMLRLVARLARDDTRVEQADWNQGIFVVHVSRSA